MHRLCKPSTALLICTVLIFTAACAPRSGQQPAPQATPVAVQTPSGPAGATPAIPAAPASPAAPATPVPAPITPAPAPATPAAPAAPVSNLKLAATSPTQMPPGGRVEFKLTFTVEGGQPLQVEVSIAWRAGSSQMSFAPYATLNAAAGPNAYPGMWIALHPQQRPGETFEVFGVVRVAGQVYFSQEAVVLTVTEPTAQATPAAPPPATPGAVPTNAPPIAPPAGPGAGGQLPGSGAPPGPGLPGPGAQPAAPAVPAPPGPQVDPRSAAIKASLEQAGLRVLEVSFTPEGGGRPAVLGAFVEANYAQPNAQAVLGLGFKILDVLYQHVTQYVTIDSQEKLKTVLVTGQQWTKYMLLFGAEVGNIAILVKTLQASPDEDTRNQAIQTFLQSARFRVFDIERQQYVDEKDFINKNFTGG